MASQRHYTLGQLAEVLDATLVGAPDIIVSGVATPETAGPDDIAFIADARSRRRGAGSRAGAFLAPVEVEDLPAPTLRCRVPRLALIDLLRLFHPVVPFRPGIDPTAVVAPDASVDASAAVGALSVIEAGAVIGPRVRVHALVYVGPGVEVGEDTVLYPHVILRESVRLGRRVIVQPGAVVGSDGFGYAFDGAVHRKIPQVGMVVVEDDVEIGANTTIDRATLGATVIGQGVKIDNLVQIGHNVEVGEHSIMAGQVGVSGSCRIGRGVVLAGQVGIADHVSLGDGVIVAAKSGVPSDILESGAYLGSPARPIGQARRILAAEGHLPELGRRLAALERRIAKLEGEGRDG